MRLPNFIIIGGEKCGTTFLHNCLSEHPQIFMPKEEVSFFEDPDYNSHLMKDLAELFLNAGGVKALGIKRPNYLNKPEVPARLKKDLKNPKIIVIIRDPIERVLSSYFHNINYSFLPPLDVEIGLRQLLSGKLQKKYLRSHEVLDFSFYHDGLSRYYKLFGKKNVLVLSYSDLKKDFLKFVRTVYKFLEVRENFTPSKRGEERPQAATYSIPRLKILTLINRFKYTYNKKRTRVFPKRPKNIIDISAIKTLNWLDKNLLQYIFPSKKPKLSPALERKLINLYRSDIKKTQKLTGIKFDFASRYLTG